MKQFIKYYDPDNNRLVYVGKTADPSFWDNIWEAEHSAKIGSISKSHDVFRYTKKYFTKEDLIIEGGCGNGNKVYLLQKMGYNVIGIDYAKDTIEQIKKEYPDLNIMYGDLRDLSFEDNSVDGFWSLGVVEHYLNGYGELMSEMTRVLKPGGILLLMVPHFSKLRKKKARKGLYPLVSGIDLNEKPFYEFALDEKEVIEYITSKGYEYLEQKTRSAFYGFSYETRRCKSLINKIAKGRNFFYRIIRKGMILFFDLFLSAYSNHTILLIFRKKMQQTN